MQPARRPANAPDRQEPIAMAATLHAGHLPGCIGRITQLHARFYAAQSSFGLDFEAKVATELAAFCTRFDPHRDGLWLAMQDGEIQGSIAIDGAQADAEGAHLRWFILAEPMRGSGTGQRLLQAALQWCVDRGYPRAYLWTFDQLHAARHLYEQHGFMLAKTHRGRQWGTEVNEQLFVKVFAGAAR
jgi:GNAT superfamily N-acetyltransferase